MRLVASQTSRRCARALLRLGRRGWLGRRVQWHCDAGMTTAEYAVGTIAAVGFAVVLYRIIRSDAVASALSSLVQSALHAI